MGKAERGDERAGERGTPFYGLSKGKVVITRKIYEEGKNG